MNRLKAENSRHVKQAQSITEEVADLKVRRDLALKPACAHTLTSSLVLHAGATESQVCGVE